MSGTPPTCTVHLCRGCCCGTLRKHPEVDHHTQRATLEDQVAALVGVRLRVTDCLGPCSESNVVVLSAPGTPPVWLGQMLTSTATAALCAWLRAGGPPTAHPPPPIRGHIFDRLALRRRRKAEAAASSGPHPGQSPTRPSGQPKLPLLE